jgi:inosose dehydratase
LVDAPLDTTSADTRGDSHGTTQEAA